MAKSTKRASTTNRRRSPRQVEQLDRQILAVLKEDNPQSVRHIFYRMTDPRLPEPVEKSDSGYRQVQQRFVALRRTDQLPYRWISDTTRRGYYVDTFSNAADFIDRMEVLYRADLWQEASARVEVWVESRSIAGVVRNLCDELAVSLFPCGGFSSISFVHQAAQDLNLGGRKPVLILYVGDYDPAGVLIDRSLETEMRKHLDPSIHLQFVRLGINATQIKELDLPIKPRKKSDRRATHVKETVEAEAMPASQLRAILREHIESCLPKGALKKASAAEQVERAQLKRLASLLSSRESM